MTPKTILQHLNRLPECVRLDVKLEFVRQGVNLDKVSLFIQTKNVLHYIKWNMSEIGECLYWALYSELVYHEQHNLKLPK